MTCLATRLSHIDRQSVQLRLNRAILPLLPGVVIAVLLAVDAGGAHASTVRTVNFEVSAESEAVARKLADCAEELRQSLAVEWLGSELPAWETRCAVRVDSNQERLSGDTTYTLAAGHAHHWQMILRGPSDRILETLLPHEVLHTILASHFCGAVPRWADEGAALSVEPEAEQKRLWALEGPQLLRGRRLSLAELFACDEYPHDQDSLRAFYVQGASVTQFLLWGGKSEFVAFVRLGVHSGWESAVRRHYGFDSLESLETAWLDWLQENRPAVTLTQGQLLAVAIDGRTSLETLTADVPAGLARTTSTGAQ